MKTIKLQNQDILTVGAHWGLLEFLKHRVMQLTKGEIVVLLRNQDKLMLLFLSKHNPLWTRLRKLEGKKTEVDADDVKIILKVSHQTLPNWTRGKSVSAKKVAANFLNPLKLLEKISETQSVPDKESKEIRKMIEDFSQAHAEGKASVDAGVDILGMTLSQGQLAVETAINFKWPLFPGLFYDIDRLSSTRATSDLHAFGGVYLVWFKQPSNEWVQATLRMQHLVPVGKGQVLRCKLNLPNLVPERRSKERAGHAYHSYLEFDGTVAVREQHVFFNLEKRLPHTGYVNFTTCRGVVVEGHRMLCGKYLTTDQVTQSIVSGTVLMRRMFDLEDMKIKDNMEPGTLMKAGPKLLAGDVENREIDLYLSSYYAAQKNPISSIP